MTDRELLEKAAKAAGMRVPESTRDGLGRFWADGKAWNPLTDDGDALRLAVKLQIDIKFYFDEMTAEVSEIMNPEVEEKDALKDEVFGDDPYAATRRAIVRAAAAIGETL